MLGTWRWNVGLGLLGPVLTILFSIGKNPLPVVLLRSVYALAAFFLLGYVLRLALGQILKSAPAKEPVLEALKGTQLDLRTPDESENLNELLKPKGGKEDTGAPGAGSADQAEFKPLNPTKLVSTQSNDPEQLAKAVRHLTGG
ncbi:hypothetical protein ACFSL6_00280 [Paenibacillus thailandensis]|uniref:Uncharacterized protein n=1 Tax=Paenibacillus thailandensis TaxID=393250 RepID=A0ABW5QWX3_9BACL